MIPDISQHGSAETTEWKPVENTPVIMFDRVSKSYGRINAMNSVSLGISGGVTGILGMNGAGKSTLFKLMMGKIKPSSGRLGCLELTPGRILRLILEWGLFPNMKKCMIG